MLSLTTIQPAIVAQKQPETTYKWMDVAPVELYYKIRGELDLAQRL